MTSMTTRTYDYEPPPPAAELRRATTRSGLDMLRAVIAREYPAPPISATLGFTLVEVDRGFAAFEGDTAEWLYNPLGSVHGGWTSTLLDSAVACAVHSTLEAGQIYTTLDLQVRFLRAVLATTGRVRAEGRIVHAGKRVATAEGRLVGSDGTLFATATTSCIVLPAP